ncbi:MAG: hypothetical protein IKC03_07460, partial [Oscillospiraceae bacterium]|nr:hypothetical protein [Oscillospiraceae bacterium]
NIAQAGRSNTQNYQQGNSRVFSGQIRNTNPVGTLRNANLNTLYTAAESNAQRSIPYAAHATSVQQQRSTPHTANNETAGQSQTLNYVDAFRQMQAEQERAVDLEYARYKELDRKFLDGSISEEEFEELRRLDNVWREVDAPSKDAGTSGASEYVRYKELESKFIDGNINEREWNELLRLENVWGQFGAAIGEGSQRYQVLDSVKHENLKRTPMDGKIIKKVVFGHAGTPKMADPKSVIDHQREGGIIDARAFYGDNGMKIKELHTSDHGNPKWHNYGQHGEHAHDYQWNEDGSLKRKTTRGWNDEERERNGDIL